MSILPTTILLTTAGSIEAELASTMAVNEQLLGPRLEVPRGGAKGATQGRGVELDTLNLWGSRVRLCVGKVFVRVSWEFEYGSIS